VVARETSWAVAVALGITLPFLLLPDGRLRSRRWRPVVADVIAGAILLVLGASLGSQQLTGGSVPVDNPFALGGAAGTVALAVAFVGLVLYAASLPAALLCVVLRFRAARGVERQQLRWVVAGGVIAVLALLPLPAWTSSTRSWGILGVVIVPMSVAVAVLRYRLYDLDRIISRTLAYGLLTVLLGLGYAAVVLLGGRLLPGSSSLTVAAATLAVAALFSPLRRRVQNLVDRRFNRRRYDAARTVEGSAARLRDQVDLVALHTELLAVVNQTMQPTLASLWLRPQGSLSGVTRGP
jgi:hypothetical protein